MRKKTIVPLLIGTVILFMLAPSKAFNQTLPQPKATNSENALSKEQVKPKPDLKAAFAKEMVNIQAPGLTAADYDQLERKRQDDASKQAAKKGWSKREKIGIVVIIGVLTAFTVAVLIRGINTDPNCVEDPFALGCS